MGIDLSLFLVSEKNRWVDWVQCEGRSVWKPLRDLAKPIAIDLRGFRFYSVGWAHPAPGSGGHAGPLQLKFSGAEKPRCVGQGVDAYGAPLTSLPYAELLAFFEGPELQGHPTACQVRELHGREHDLAILYWH